MLNYNPPIRSKELSEIDIADHFDSIKKQIEYFRKEINNDNDITELDLIFPSALECFEYDILKHIKVENEHDEASLESVIRIYNEFCYTLGLHPSKEFYRDLYWAPTREIKAYITRRYMNTRIAKASYKIAMEELDNEINISSGYEKERLEQMRRHYKMVSFRYI